MELFFCFSQLGYKKGPASNLMEQKGMYGAPVGSHHYQQVDFTSLKKNKIINKITTIEKECVLTKKLE